MVNTRLSRAIVIATLCLFGCTDSDIPDAELVGTYADVIVARQQYGDSLAVRRAVDSILLARDLDADEFDAELRAMSRTPQLFKAFYDSVSIELNRRRDSLKP